MPLHRRKEGGMRAFQRRQVMKMATEEVYNGNARWKYDTAQMGASYPYHGGRIWVESGWCYLNNPSAGYIKWYATTVSGRHKTLDVKEGQKYKIQACANFPTQIVFINDHVYAAGAQRVASCVTIPAGEERVITVPSGFQYMMIHAFRQTGSEMRFPDRIARVIGYG